MTSFSPHNSHHLSFSSPHLGPVPSATSPSTPVQEHETIMTPPSPFLLSPFCPNKTTHQVAQSSGSSFLCNSYIHKQCVMKTPANDYKEHSVALRSNCSSSPTMVMELDDQTAHLEKEKKKRKSMTSKVVRQEKWKKEDKSGEGICMKGKRKISEKIRRPASSTDYVLVRARRGQATDSHSLAERVRREKISERMRLLQSLVPGCDKITGKTQILDEIINYVQTLQNQVEFLVMKITSLYPMLNDSEITTSAPEGLYKDGTSLFFPQTDYNQLIDTTIPTKWQDFSTFSFLENNDNPCNFISQDNADYFWEIEDQNQKLQSIGDVCEVNNLYCSF